MKKSFRVVVALIIVWMILSIYPVDASEIEIDLAVGNIHEEELVSVKRVINSESPARFAVNQLLNIKFTEMEKRMGYYSPFEDNQGRLILVDINLDDGILVLIFEDKTYFSSGGSARVCHMRDAITQTALQFGSVKEVVILPEEILQP